MHASCPGGARPAYAAGVRHLCPFCRPVCTTPQLYFAHTTKPDLQSLSCLHTVASMRAYRCILCQSPVPAGSSQAAAKLRHTPKIRRTTITTAHDTITNTCAAVGSQRKARLRAEALVASPDGLTRCAMGLKWLQFDLIYCGEGTQPLLSQQAAGQKALSTWQLGGKTAGTAPPHHLSRHLDFE